MLLAIILIVLGALLLLQAFGIALGVHFWGIVGALILLAIGLRLLIKRGRCPMCYGYMWHEKMHKKMHDHCECGHEHEKQE